MSTSDIMEQALAGSDNNPGWKTIAVGAAIVFLLAFAIRATNYQHQPITDELYHLLAAESWADDGTLGIADGEYRRASAFTRLIGIVYDSSGGDINSIRLFGIFLGSLLVAGVFSWTIRFAGLGSAVVASAMLALMPGAIFLSQHIRFYSLHALVFFCIATGSYWLFSCRASVTSRAFAVGGLALLVLLGIHLQVTTLIGIAGIGLWVVLFRGAQITGWLRASKFRLATAVIVTIVAIATLFSAESLLSELLGLYQSSAMWNSGDGPAFYHTFYRNQFGAFWSLAPAAFVVALLVRPVPALFCTCIFVVAIVVQSFGGMRAERFLFYAMPFFVINWGIALGAVAAILRGFIEEGIRRTDLAVLKGAVGRMLPTATAFAVFGFLIASTPAVTITAKMILGKTTTLFGSPVYWSRYRTDWEGAAPILKKLSTTSEVTIVTQALQAQYYLGAFDYAISATALADVRSFGVTDGVDPRTGRVVIDSADELSRIRSCNRSGLVIIHQPAWRNKSRVNDEVADLIELRMVEVELPAKLGFLAFQWQSPVTNCPFPRS